MIILAIKIQHSQLDQGCAGAGVQITYNRRRERGERWGLRTQVWGNSQTPHFLSLVFIKILCSSESDVRSLLQHLLCDVGKLLNLYETQFPQL